jgi:hypothetical protein
MSRDVVMGGVGLTCLNAQAQQRRQTQQSRDVQTYQQRYGVQGGYNTSVLHPDGRPTAAIPVYVEEGRTGSGELLIPQSSDPHTLYYRDDGTARSTRFG